VSEEWRFSLRRENADILSSPESRKFVRGLEAVVDYANRIHDEYFPDYKKWD
jgi:hypothetical protein